MQYAIITIVFNTYRFINKQWELFSTLFPDATFVIVDNSDSEHSEVSFYLNEYAKERNIRYIKILFEEKDFSRSHALCANRVFYLLHKEFKYLFFVDHDLFPKESFDIDNLMSDRVIAGVEQDKDGVKYLWAGMVIMNTQLIDVNAVDFSPRPGIDTGGELHKIIDQLPKEKYHLFAERPQPAYSNIYYDRWTTIDKPLFIHVRNGSNWANEEAHNERINQVMEMI